MKKAVILLNMGGPNSLNEVSVFLKNMFNDPCILGIKNRFLRKFVAFMIAKFREKSAINNYKMIGSRSPINEITAKLCKKINSMQDEFSIDYAMNYTAPFSKDVLKKYEDFDEILLFPLYPHHSITTFNSSVEDAKKNLKDKNLKVIDVFYDNPLYNRIILNLIKNSLKNEKEGEISLIFSAHSLPQKIIDNGDLYENHIKNHTKILCDLLKKEGLNFKEIILAYQSRLGPVKWLGPNLSDVLENLSSKKALIFPIAFCIDNSETDFEIAIEYKKIATNRDFKFYEVCRCPNDSDEFAKFIIDYSKLFFTN